MRYIFLILVLAGCGAKVLYTPHISLRNHVSLHCSVGIGSIEVPDYAAIGKIYNSKTKKYIKNFRLVGGLDKILQNALLHNLPAQSSVLYPWSSKMPQAVVQARINTFIWDEKELMMDGVVIIGTKYFPFKQKVRAVSLSKAIDRMLQGFVLFVTTHLRHMCEK